MPPDVVSISIDTDVLQQAKQRAKQLGYKSFSAYCEQVFRAEVTQAGPHILNPNNTAFSLNDSAVAPVPAIVTAPIKIYRHKRSKTNP